jgi:hypothetical protein
MYDKYVFIQFTEKGKRLEPLITQYFNNRKKSEEQPDELENLTLYYNYKIRTSLIAEINKNYEN